MKKKILIPMLLVAFGAFLCANFVYERYQENLLADSGNVYLLQAGVYQNADSIQDLKENHIVVEENHKFYTYMGITTEKKNAEKIKQFYEKKNIPIYIKSESLGNQEFLSALSQFDILLEEANNEEEIENILGTILSTYEEVIKME